MRKDASKVSKVSKVRKGKRMWQKVGDMTGPGPEIVDEVSRWEFGRRATCLFFYDELLPSTDTECGICSLFILPRDCLRVCSENVHVSNAHVKNEHYECNTNLMRQPREEYKFPIV